MSRYERDPKTFFEEVVDELVARGVDRDSAIVASNIIQPGNGDEKYLLVVRDGKVEITSMTKDQVEF